MERHHRAGRRSEPERGGEGVAPDPWRLNVLRRYAAGELSARDAAGELGPGATQHDVFAGVIEARLPLPTPPPAELEREVAALRALYGPHS